MNRLQIAILYGSIIGTILSRFEHTNRTIEDVKRQVRRFKEQREKSNPREYFEAAILGGKIWEDTLNHFADQNLRIDAFSVIVAVWSSEARLLARFINLTEKRMERFSMLNDNELLDEELDAYKVAEYLRAEINKHIGGEG